MTIHVLFPNSNTKNRITIQFQYLQSYYHLQTWCTV